MHSLDVAHVVDFTGRRDVKPVSAPFAGLIFIQPDYTLVADREGSATQSRIWILDTHCTDFHAPRHVRGDEIAARLVEHGLFHTWIRGAERFPVPEECIPRGHEFIAHQTRLEPHLWLAGLQLVLLYDLSAKVRNIVTRK